MNKRKRSVIWRMPVDELRDLVESSVSIGAVLGVFGLKNKGGNYRTLTARLKQLGIPFDKFSKNFGVGRIGSPVPAELAFAVNSSYPRASLKKRIIKGRLLPNKCAVCGTPPEWRGKILSLVLDHINGVSNDNRLENLRLLCPNCNSQTPTFAGRNNKNKLSVNNCVDCDKVICNAAIRCKKCVGKITGLTRRAVKQRPSLDVLIKETSELGFCAVGRKYGVSDNAIRKWMGLKK